MKELICIICPRGCHLQVDETRNYAVRGNFCKRGEEYGKNELQHPVRVLTSIVRIEGAAHACCPVKTDGGIPKDQIFGAMDALKPVVLKAPVKMGDVIVKDVCGTSVCWIATKTMDRIED